MTARPGRIAGLDVLRGVAILLVMARHALPEWFAGAGVVGVTMFFALSAYLITGLLVEEHERTGRVDLRRFYARRVRRLVPALVVLVLGVVVLTLVLDPLHDRDELGRTVLFALTWTGNLPFGHASDATFHLWTLATEEQFYLVWPALLIVLGGRRGLVVAAVSSVAALLATVAWSWDAPDVAYALPTSWAVCFVIGGAARVLRDRLDGVLSWRGALPAAVACLVVLSVLPVRGHVATYLVVGPVVAAATCALVLRWRTWASVRTPALRSLVWVGTVSYGAYLWNYPLTLWLRPQLPTPVAGLLAVVLTLVLAALSRRFVEAPFERRREPVMVTS